MSDDSAGQENKLTGVDLAYGLVHSSYDWTVARLNAVENRIQALMVFSASFVLTAPVLTATAATDISLTSWWFYLALVMGGLHLLLGTIMRALGGKHPTGLGYGTRRMVEIHRVRFQVRGRLLGNTAFREEREDRQL